MILYTTMPQELIFPASEQEYQKQSVVNMNGVQLVVQSHSQDRWEIVRLLSSNPNDYLDSKLQPGQLISLNPTFE